MECVNCTACIDACDGIMDRIGRPRGLIRFASHDNIERGERQRFTLRMAGYCGVLLVLISVFAFLLFTRSEVETTLLRAPGALFTETPGGNIENLYTLKLANKTSREIPVQLKLENIEGKLQVMGGRDLVVPGEKLAETSVLIEIAHGVLRRRNTRLKVGVYSNGKLLETVKTVFVGPRDDLEKHDEEHEHKRDHD
jgi:polyferredoxin